MTMVELSNVVRRYGSGSTQVLALRGVSFQARSGELISIMGPSGSGKTTLLSIIGGLINPTAGNVRIDGLEITDLSERDLDDFRLKTVGFVFQSLNLIPSLNALENIQLPLLANDVDFITARERASELLEIVDLTDRAHHRPSQLSGGEQQRVAIATALANDPPLVLADEPTGNLDSKNTRDLMTYFQKLSKELDKAVIVVTHDSLVATSTDHICIIRDGIIETRVKPSNFQQTGPGRYVDYFRHRIQEIDASVNALEVQLRNRTISGKDYASKLEEYSQTRRVLVSELSSLGDAEFAHT